MKRLLLSTALVAVCTSAASAQWYEDFDSYAPNSQIVGQGGWEEWGPGSGALVSNAQSRTPGNSVNITGPSDLVYQYSGYNTGTWVYKAHQFIPTGTTGSSYFIMLNSYAYPAGPYSWSMQLLFNATTGQVSQNCGGPAVISMPFVFNQWSEIKVVVDLGQDWVQIYYNGVLFDDPAVADHPTLGGGYRWSLGDGGTNTTGQANIAAVDLYANNASPVYYDDMSLTRLNTWRDDFDAYAANSQVVGQGGWEEWSAGAGALVSPAAARSTPNSVAVVGATDLVHQYSGINAGKWVYRAWQYIPTGTTGSSYFILLNTYAYPAGPYSWSMQLLFNAATGQASQRCGGTATISMPFVFNQWAEIKVVLHLDQDWVQLYYNNVLFDDPAVADHATLGGGYRWSLGDGGTNTTGLVNFAAVDLFANNASVVYYDDISLTPFDYESFGVGCAGSNGVPALNGIGRPRIGSPFRVSLTNLNTTSTFALMFTSLSSTTWPLGPLPASLTPFGLTGCTAYVDPQVFELVASTAGSALYQVPIPLITTLIGMPFFHQGGSIDPGVNPAGLTVTNAGAGFIGN